MIHDQYLMVEKAAETSLKAAKLKLVIDDGFDLLYNLAKSQGLKVNNSDDAERLVEAIAVYLIESGNEI